MSDFKIDKEYSSVQEFETTGNIKESPHSEQTINIFSVEYWGDNFYIRTDETVEDVMEAANRVKADGSLQELLNMGTQISIAEYAEIEQSKNVAYSLELNFDNDTAQLCTINDGKGGIGEADRTDENVSFDYFDIGQKETNKENIKDSSSQDNRNKLRMLQGKAR